ncbi:MAG TPA: type I polyketide synthase, partial [Solirubrobacterales bacterium]
AEQGEGVPFPSSWSEVSLEAAGAVELRVRLAVSDEAASLDLYDQGGMALAGVGVLAMRRLPAGDFGAVRRDEGLFELDWGEAPDETKSRPASSDSLGRLTILGELEFPDPGVERFESLEALRAELDEDTLPGTVLCELGVADSKGLPEAAGESTRQALALVQEWLAEERLEKSRLAILTRGAVATRAGESPDLSAAPLWGLLRSAQLERPEAFVLVDVDAAESSLQALPAALAGAEPQIALRDGVALIPHAVRASAGDGDVEDRGPAFDGEATVLITGGTSGLGALMARHLVTEHGAGRLLLVSRRGRGAEGAAALEAELTELGAEVTIAACDSSKREQLEALLDSIPADRPLGAVVHAAGILDGGGIHEIAPDQIDRVFAPKVDGAWHLHELTRHLDLSAFVLFSSMSGILGGFGISTYAAANSFLDALAQQRQAQGLPATSMAWAFWTEAGGMTAGIETAQQERMGRSGAGLLSNEQGLALFDAALSADRALSLATRLNRTDLRRQAEGGTLSPVLRGLVRARALRRAAPGSLAATLLALPEAEQLEAVLDVVRAQVAIVLGHESAGDIDPNQAFQDIGFTSIAAVELRNRLGAATGLPLPATLVFDYPTPTAVASYLRAEALEEERSTPVATALRVASDEPIAVIGMSCRLPGGVGTPKELWGLLSGAGDGISEFPTDRGWGDMRRLYEPDAENHGSGFDGEGGFVHDSSEFDAAFFGISPREALATDPQQRLLLEAAWEALEDAGIDPRSLQGSQAGVFAGAGQSSYGGVEAMQAGYGLTGSLTSVLSGRVAYTLGLEGPAMTVDTACSSSLVALHLAAQALRQGECELALAGGVAVLVTPFALAEFSRQGGLAPDGRSKSFAEGADGVGFSEGAGVLALQRLSDAQREGNPVLALLKGSAVNQDGASNGLTAPNGPSQERVIRQALANARLEPKDIDAVEAHGTGTTLGDPIEAGALLA